MSAPTLHVSPTPQSPPTGTSLASPLQHGHVSASQNYAHASAAASSAAVQANTTSAARDLAQSLISQAPGTQSVVPNITIDKVNRVTSPERLSVKSAWSSRPSRLQSLMNHPSTSNPPSGKTVLRKSEPIDNETVAQYLLDKNYHLTALEFFQECQEEGIEIIALKEWFNSNLVVRDDRDWKISLLTRVDSFSEVNKDEQIAVLEREMRLLQEDLEKTKESLHKLQQQMKEQKQSTRIQLDNRVAQSSNETNLNATASEGEVDVSKSMIEETNDFELVPIENLFRAPPTADEIDILNYLVNKYLRSLNYKITLASFVDECDRIPTADEIDSMLPFPTELHHYVRCFEHVPQTFLQKKSSLPPIRPEGPSISSPKRQAATPVLNEISMKSLNLGHNPLSDVSDGLVLQLNGVIIDEFFGQISPSVSPRMKKVTIDKQDTFATNRRKFRLKHQRQTSTGEPLEEKPLEVMVESRPKQIDGSESIPTPALSSVNQPAIANFDLIHVVRMMGDCLPKIVSGYQRRREELVPLLCAAIVTHPSSKTRLSLLNHLIGIFSNPDAIQRRLIVSSIVSIVQNSPPERISHEILQPCIEQINNKALERRILVVELLDSLLPLLDEEHYNNKVFPVIAHLVQDNSPDVRQSAVRGLVNLLPYITDSSIYGNIREVLFKAIVDNSPEVCKDALGNLFPAVVEWFQGSGLLCEELMDSILGFLADHSKAVSKQKDIFSPEAPEQLHSCEVAIELLNQTLPYIFCEALFQGPFARAALSAASSQDRDGFTLSDPLLQQLKISYDIYVQEKASCWTNEDWKTIAWLENIFLPSFTSIVESTPTSSPTLPSCAKFLQNLCHTFGEGMSRLVIKQYYIEEIHRLGNISYEQTNSPAKAPRTDSPAFTVSESRQQVSKLFIIGVLVALPLSEMRSFIHELCVNIALEKDGWSRGDVTVLLYSLSYLSKFSKFEDEVVNLVCEVQAIIDPNVRLVVIDCLKELITTVRPSIVGNRILPTLLILSEDDDRAVRSGSIQGLGCILGNTLEKNVVEQIVFKIDSILHEGDYDKIAQVLHTLTKLIPSSSAIRDSLLFPKMYMIAELLFLDPTKPQRNLIATELLDGFLNSAGCHDIKKDVIIEFILPTLRLMTQEPELLDPSRRGHLSSLLKDFDCRSQQDTEPVTLQQNERLLSRLLRATLSLQKGSVRQMFSRDKGREKEREREKEKEKEKDVGKENLESDTEEGPSAV